MPRTIAATETSQTDTFDQIRPANAPRRYFAPLDGIRAIAILAVLLFHISPSALRGGFTGVDVFFVLSGFLITSIILNDLREGSFSIREFYLRRIQRLSPNVVVTVLGVLLLWIIFLPQSTARQVGQHGLWTLFNLSNIYVWKNLGGYLGQAAEWAPLTHTWSLGVEEQFYLFYPGSLLLLVRFQPGRVQSWLTVATILGFGLCLYGTYTHPVATFYYLPTRVWELLLGAALAAHRMPLRTRVAQLRRTLGRNAQEAIGLTGLGLIIVGYILIPDVSSFPGWVAIAPTTGTALVLFSLADEHTRLAQGLSCSFLVGTGKLSYSLYLWHWPLITLGKTLASLYGKPLIYGSVAGAIVGILLALGVFVFVEKPLRKRSPGRTWRLAVIATGFSIVAFGAVAVSSRRRVADPDHRFDTPTFFGDLYTAGKALPDPATRLGFYDAYVEPRPVRPDDSWRTGGVVHLFGGGHPKVVVFGSSHALMYAKLIDDICRKMGISVAFLAAEYGAPAFFTHTLNTNFFSPIEAQLFDEARRNWLREWHPEALFVVDRWIESAGTPRGFDKDLRSFLTEVSPMVGRVLLVAQVPVLGGADLVNLREFVTWRMRAVKDLPQFDPDQEEPLRKQSVALAEAATKDFPNLHVLRADLPFYKEDGSVRYLSGRTFFYVDNNHLTSAGAEVVRGLFQCAIADAHRSALP